MAKTPGTIIELARDRTGRVGYRLIVPLSRDPLTGKRRQSWVTLRGGTRREAERELARLVVKASEGESLAGARLTVNAYLDRWLHDSVTDRVGPSTLQRYGELLVHLRPYIGRKSLASLAPLDIQYAYSHLRDSAGPHHLSARTVLGVHRVLHSALVQALRWGYVTRNVSELVDAPRARQYEAVMLSPEDVVRALGAADATPFGPIVRLAVLTGMRQGEILALRWSDVDLAKGVAYVQRNARRLKGRGIVFGNTKTARSSRPVPLSSDVVALLHTQRSLQHSARLQRISAHRDDSLVFAKENGAPLDGAYVTHCWRAATRSIGIDARFHDLRHSFAALALKGGVSVKVVSEILGHSSTAITENLYTAVLPGLKEDAVSAVASLISDAMVRDGLDIPAGSER